MRHFVRTGRKLSEAEKEAYRQERNEAFDRAARPAITRLRWWLNIGRVHLEVFAGSAAFWGAWYSVFYAGQWIKRGFTDRSL